MSAQATQILHAISNGNRAEADRLTELVYADLRRLAHVQLSGAPPTPLLNPTALVHEAFLKLIDGDIDLRSRSHFLLLGAKAMRHICVDYARQSGALKRGGDRYRIPLAEELIISVKRDEHVLAVDQALEALAEIDAERAAIVEMRFFAGMTIKEVAAALGKSERAVAKRWAVTRIWLRKYLTEDA